MHQRRLPPFPNLGSFLSYLKTHDALRTVTAPVAMRLELTELHRRVIATAGPALRLTAALADDGCGRAHGVSSFIRCMT
ncbi:MAG: UbiD family decarboxylase [Rhizobiales bacterium]|nr:UbiD family decarboxylase [Hyphomicrobiales bacterium]